MNLHFGRSLTREEISALLDEARERTLQLIAPLGESELAVQHNPLMSPIIWDLGHIAHFEQVWLVEALDTDSAHAEGLRGMYDPSNHPRSTRADLDLPSLEQGLAYMAGIRTQVENRLAQLDPSIDEPLRRDGFVFRMVLQHEYQHNETVLQTMQLKQGTPYAAPRVEDHAPGGASFEPGRDMVRFPGGEVDIGTDDRSTAYDNERPRHRIMLPPFHIDRTPVTNGDYLAFIEDGGYRNREHWTDESWEWRNDTLVPGPKYWRKQDGEWVVRRLDREGPVELDHPVCHVCFYEAEAYARWAGKRLPTEFEWETAATWDPASGTRRIFPWGDEPWSPDLANLDVLAFRTAPVGAYPRNVSALGCYGMIGDVWEWTSTDFHGYPGYETFPYPDYSEAFFGDEYKVLRGGSWATRPGAIRSTFRNWDFPIRRQIFSGFRCARDNE